MYTCWAKARPMERGALFNLPFDSFWFEEKTAAAFDAAAVLHSDQRRFLFRTNISSGLCLPKGSSSLSLGRFFAGSSVFSVGPVFSPVITALPDLVSLR